MEGAYKRLLENPIFYLEDYQWMGPKAFAYYFPVVDEFVRNAVPIAIIDELELNTIRFALQSQLDPAGRLPESVLFEVRALVAHVLDDPAPYSSNDRAAKQIVREWEKVETLLDQSR